MARHRPLRHGPPDIAIRAAGVVLLAIAATAIAELHALGPEGTQPPEGLIPYLLALVGFAGASAGSAMVMLGRHLFDPVHVSRLWSAYPAEIVDMSLAGQAMADAPREAPGLLFAETPRSVRRA